MRPIIEGLNEALTWRTYKKKWRKKNDSSTTSIRTTQICVTSTERCLAPAQRSSAAGRLNSEFATEPWETAQTVFVRVNMKQTFPSYDIRVTAGYNEVLRVYREIVQKGLLTIPVGHTVYPYSKKNNGASQHDTPMRTSQFPRRYALTMARVSKSRLL